MTIIASTKGNATESGHSLWAGMAVESAGPLAARGGVIAGLELTKTTGMGWQIGAGRGGIQFTTAAAGGWVPFAVTVAETGAFTPGDSVKARIDLIYAQIVGSLVTLGTVAGALPSSGSPVAPSVPPDAIPLWYVPIPAGTSAGTGGWTLSGAIDARRFLAGGGQAGDIKFSAAASSPGWLIANGQAVSRSIYSELFAAIGTQYGVGDGVSTFNLPDLRERTAVGVMSGSAEFGARGATAGAKTHTLTSAQMPSHQHSYNAAQFINVVVQSGSGNPSMWGGALAGTATTATGGGAAHNNIQPSIALTPLIKF
jgi:microcystin-dependent protein